MPNDDAYAFEFEGQQYRLKKLMLAEARAIQKEIRKTYLEWNEGLQKGDPDCLTALVWVARKRSEPTLKFEDVDGDLLSFKDLDDEDDEPRAEGNDLSPDGTPPTPAGV